MTASNSKENALKYHPAAEIFPLMDNEALRSLADDIAENGLQVPIEICDKMIIDGRNRWLACEMAGVEADTYEVSPSDPVAYAVSLNLHRRHLTTPQRAVVAARAENSYAAKAKERQKLSKGAGVKGPVNLPDLKGDARDQVAELFKVSGKSVSDAKKVIDNGSSALVSKVEAGDISISAAAKLSKLPKAEQNAALKQDKKAIAALAKEISKPDPPKHPASENFDWALGNFIGAILALEQDYGGFAEATKHKDWQKSITHEIVAQLDGLADTLGDINKEIKKHGIK